MKKRRFLFLKIRIVEVLGELSDVSDFIVQWRVKFTPWWFTLTTKEFNVSKVKIFKTYSEALKYVSYRVERKKKISITNV